MQAASGSAIWAYAPKASSTVVTKVEDFAQRELLTNRGPVVTWVRLPNTRGRGLLAWFESVLPDVGAALERGETLIDVA